MKRIHKSDFCEMIFQELFKSGFCEMFLENQCSWNDTLREFLHQNSDFQRMLNSEKPTEKFGFFWIYQFQQKCTENSCDSVTLRFPLTLSGFL